LTDVVAVEKAFLDCSKTTLTYWLTKDHELFLRVQKEKYQLKSALKFIGYFSFFPDFFKQNYKVNPTETFVLKFIQKEKEIFFNLAFKEIFSNFQSCLKGEYIKKND
jgi:hypothetical protein